MALPTSAKHEIMNGNPSAYVADALVDSANLSVDVTAGTVVASSIVVVDANKDIASFRHVTATGTLTVGAITGNDAALDIAANDSNGAVNVASTGKVGFYGVTAVARASAYTQTYATADKTHANPTATALTHTAVGGTADGTLVDCTGTYSEAAVEENFKECATAINAIIVDLADLKQLVNSIIDDLQLYGLLQ